MRKLPPGCYLWAAGLALVFLVCLLMRHPSQPYGGYQWPTHPAPVSTGNDSYEDQGEGVKYPATFPCPCGKPLPTPTPSPSPSSSSSGGSITCYGCTIVNKP